MIQLTQLRIARFTGPDAGEFLQSQLSADVLALTTGQATFACLCTPKGKVIALLLVCRDHDGFIVAGHRDLLSAALERLKIFVFRSKVEFSLQPELRLFGVADEGKESAKHCFETGETGLKYTIGEAALAESLSADEWKSRELRRGVFWLDSRTTEKFIPQMLGFEAIGALSFSKGCYPGQEIVARARYLGSVKRGPLLLETGESVEPGSGEKIEVKRDGLWSDAVVIESVPVSGGALVAAVTSREPETHADEIRYRERSLHCAQG